MTTKFYTTQYDPHWLRSVANPPYGEYLNMPTAPGKTQSALLPLIDAQSYDYLEREAPEYLDGIRRDLAAGLTPDQIYHAVLTYNNYQRDAIAQRILQAARHLSRTHAG